MNVSLETTVRQPDINPTLGPNDWLDLSSAQRQRTFTKSQCQARLGNMPTESCVQHNSFNCKSATSDDKLTKPLITDSLPPSPHSLAPPLLALLESEFTDVSFFCAAAPTQIRFYRPVELEATKQGRFNNTNMPKCIVACELSVSKSRYRNLKSYRTRLESYRFVSVSAGGCF